MGEPSGAPASKGKADAFLFPKHDRSVLQRRLMLFTFYSPGTSRQSFEHLHIPYLVTGSVAAMAYREPRLTNDIDVVADIADRHITDLPR